MNIKAVKIDETLFKIIHSFKSHKIIKTQKITTQKIVINCSNEFVGEITKLRQ